MRWEEYVIEGVSGKWDGGRVGAVCDGGIVGGSAREWDRCASEGKLQE